MFRPSEEISQTVKRANEKQNRAKSIENKLRASIKAEHPNWNDAQVDEWLRGRQEGW